MVCISQTRFHGQLLEQTPERGFAIRQPIASPVLSVGIQKIKRKEAGTASPEKQVIELRASLSIETHNLAIQHHSIAARK
jgi:hypothetical protein